MNRKQLVLYSSLIWLAPFAISADPMSASGQAVTKYSTAKKADLTKVRIAQDTNTEIVRSAAIDPGFVSVAAGGHTKFSTLGPRARHSVVAHADSSEDLSIAHRDNSLLGRLSRVKSVSLVTFLETGKTRVFLGVNRDGRPGIHFNSRAKRSEDNRHLALYHMPYLSDED